MADIFLEDVLEPRAAPGASAPPPPPESPSADELATKTGLYRIGSDENHIVLMSIRDGKVRDSSLVVQSSTLHPVFKDAFVGDYMGTVRFVRDARGAVSGFTLNRNSARGVRFQRVTRAS